MDECPADAPPGTSFGAMAGSVTCLADIVAPADDAWDVDA